MHFIEHIIEPTKLFLMWQPLNTKSPLRYAVAELNRSDERISLTYLTDTSDFEKAQKLGFEGYPAFKDVHKIHETGVLDALMCRLPPRSRGDFVEYLRGLRIKPTAQFSDFALLGYSGCKLPSDGFSIIHPFNSVKGCCEFLLEVTGYKNINDAAALNLKVGDIASFKKDVDLTQQEQAIKIYVDQQHIGYVSRVLLPTFHEWLDHHRITHTWIEKKNGSPEQPTLYLYVKVSSN